MRPTARFGALSLLGLTLLAAGCGTVGGVFGPAPGVSAEACRGADWRETGKTDGLRGHPPERYQRYRAACEGFGVIPDPAAYAEGRAEGLALYCTPAQAYEEGRAGRSLRAGACPNAGPERADAYAHGRRYREIARELRALDDRSAGLTPGGAVGAGSAGSRAPLYAQPEFNPISPRKRAALEEELRRYDRWPPVE